MATLAPVRIVLVACACVQAAHAQGLPPSAPTSPAPASTIAHSSSTSSRAPLITWQDNLLSISADNASLNQILLEVSRVTGIHITGGVADERVYGSYGPAQAGAVLERLLNGTSSNLLFVEPYPATADAPAVPGQLILSPRQGGVTPPSPSTYQAAEPPPLNRPPQQMPRVLPPRSVAADLPAGQPPSPPAAAPATAPADSTTQQSPNGVKTPEQIYEQLLKLQQQNAKSTTAPPG